MTGPEFAGFIARLGLTQAELAREIEALTGHRMSPSTLTRMCYPSDNPQHRKPSPYLEAYLRLREQKGPPVAK